MIAGSSTRLPLQAEILTAVGLVVAPFILDALGAAPNTVNRVLVMGLFGIGFDILFGYTGLLSFGQSALFGTGGMVAAYLLTTAGMSSVVLALLIGTVAAAVVGYLVGLVALRRTGIYFAMITVAIAEVFFFLEFNPLSHWTGGENGLSGVPVPVFDMFGYKYTFKTGWSMYPFVALFFFIGMVLALRIVRSPVGVVFRAIRENPLRAAAVGHDIHAYKLVAFIIAAAYGGLAGGLLGVMQGFMQPDAFMFHTSGELVIQTAIGGTGTLFGPLLGAAVWLFLQDFLQGTLHMGSTWRLALGFVFVLLVVFLRRGIIGGFADLYALMKRKAPVAAPGRGVGGAASPAATRSAPPRRRATVATEGPVLQVKGLTKHYGGVHANTDIDFVVPRGGLRGIIGPNGAGKSTFFKMLTCEVTPTSGRITFEGRDITGKGVTEVCQLGLTKSYQVNQLFDKLTVAENVIISALAERRGKFKLDLLSRVDRVQGLSQQVTQTLELVHLTHRADTRVSELAYGEKRRLEVGLALASSPSLLLLDEPLAGMSPAERVETVKLLRSIAEGRTLIIIDHDMDSLFELAAHVTVLQEGRILAEGTPAEIKSNKAVQEAYLGGMHAVGQPS
ncbi:MAG TPA: branched-chain amino acid ABC transporter ATP-binding protein/permease [Burkholderiaceae bacterium]|nr:branched-chain amino acid ABC transporter ATP-binding protein/permease [Burkholderiaceae bacterium]